MLGVPDENGNVVLLRPDRDVPVGGRLYWCCLLYTSDAADERSSVDLGGRRIIKKKKTRELLVDKHKTIE